MWAMGGLPDMPDGKSLQAGRCWELVEVRVKV